jgi:hypothetical protein
MLHNVQVRLLLALLSAVALGWGQATSTINGSVNDPSGAIVPAARITATEVETGLVRTTVSNSDGLYVLNSLRPTKYTLLIEAHSFRNFTQTSVVLQANDTRDD